jgi:Ca-activated chloride channel family protein
MVRFLTWKAQAAAVALCLFVLTHTEYSQEARSLKNGQDRNLLLIRVTVTDPLNRYVMGLEKSHFRIRENDVLQAIDYFAHQTAPIDFGIIYDLRGEAADKLDETAYAIKRFLDSANSEDEVLLVLFHDRFARVQSFSLHGSSNETVPSFGQIMGLTPLDEAIHVGLLKIGKGSLRKRALVVITGATEQEVTLACKGWQIDEDPGLPVYIIRKASATEPGPRKEKKGGVYLLNDFAEQGYYLDLIHAELCNQYILGYTPLTASPRDKSRNMTVVLDPPKGLPKLNVKATKGYPAPDNK